MANEVYQNSYSEQCDSESVSNNEIASFKKEINNIKFNNDPLQEKIIGVIIGLESYASSIQGYESNCFTFLSIKLSNLILSDFFNYKKWLAFISQRIEELNGNSQRKNISQNYIHFLQIFEHYWFYNLLATIEQVQFEEDWEELKFNLRAFASTLGVAGGVFKLPRSIFFKLVRTPQIRAAVVRRVAPLTTVSAVKDSENSFAEKISELSDAEIEELLSSPLMVLEDSTSQPLESYGLGVDIDVENLNFNHISQGLIVKSASLGGGITLGLFADLALSKTSVIPYLKSKNIFFDKILEGKEFKAKPKKEKPKKPPLRTRVKNFFSGIKSTPQKVKLSVLALPGKASSVVKAVPGKVITASQKVPGVVKSGIAVTKGFVRENANREGLKKAVNYGKSIWFNLAVSVGISIVTTSMIRETLQDYYVQANEDEYKEELQKLKNQFLNSKSDLEYFKNSSKLFTYMAQYGNFRSRSLVAQRIDLSNGIAKKIEPAIFCSKYYRKDFYELINGEVFLTEQGLSAVNKVFNKNKLALTKEVEDEIKNNRSLAEQTLNEFNKIAELLSSVQFMGQDFMLLELENYISQLKDLQKVDINLSVIKAGIENNVAVTSFANINPADETSWVNNFYKKGLIINKRPASFCRDYIKL